MNADVGRHRPGAGDRSRTARSPVPAATCRSGSTPPTATRRCRSRCGSTAAGSSPGSIDEHDTACRQLAEAAGSIVVSVGYRLAPEHRYPAAADDCFAALQWVADARRRDRRRSRPAGRRRRLGGGNLAAVVALRARDAGGPPLRFQVLVYPVVDAADDTGTTAGVPPPAPRAGRSKALRVYAGDARPRRSPRSPRSTPTSSGCRRP